MFFSRESGSRYRYERENWAKGFPMKKTYEKPVLSKRQKLSSVVANASILK